MHVNDLLKIAVDNGASDLHLKVGGFPMMPGLGRFRCNIFQQRGTVGLVLRVIPMQIRTIDELGLPAVMKQIALEERGLVLVTGTTGSGKSTTLAAMIDHIHATETSHTITNADPIV